MVTVSHEFVAERLWLLVAVVTLPLTALAAVFGGVLPLPGAIVALLVTGIPIVGWLLLTPLLLLFGDEVADAVVGPPEGTGAAEATAATAQDPVASLKRRYANGEIDEAEFEHRLDRLLALDEIDDDVDTSGGGDSARSGTNGESSTNEHSQGRTSDEDELLERE